jgi:hypothetical protein
MTFLLSLFLGLAKRRDDVIIFMKTGKRMRKAIDGYNLKFVDTAMAIMAAVVIVAYVTYAASPDVVNRFHCQHLYLTSLFVIMGIMRYLQMAFVEGKGGSPVRALVEDSFLQVVIAGWILAFVWILYLG